MAEHVRTCESCRSGKECESARQIINSYSGSRLIDALSEALEDRSHQSVHRKKYMRQYGTAYMREWRKKQAAARSLLTQNSEPNSTD